MTSVNSHFSSHFPPVYYIVVDIQFARHATVFTNLYVLSASTIYQIPFGSVFVALISLRVSCTSPSARYSLHSHRFASHAPRLRLGIRCTHIYIKRRSLLPASRRRLLLSMYAWVAMRLHHSHAAAHWRGSRGIFFNISYYGLGC